MASLWRTRALSAKYLFWWSRLGDVCETMVFMSGRGSCSRVRWLLTQPGTMVSWVAVPKPRPVVSVTFCQGCCLAVRCLGTYVPAKSHRWLYA